MSFWDPLQGVTEPEFSISSQRLGRVIQSLVYLAESAKCRVNSLEHGMSNADEILYVGRGRQISQF